MRKLYGDKATMEWHGIRFTIGYDGKNLGLVGKCKNIPQPVKLAIMSWCSTHHEDLPLDEFLDIQFPSGTS